MGDVQPPHTVASHGNVSHDGEASRHTDAIQASGSRSGSHSGNASYRHSDVSHHTDEHVSSLSSSTRAGQKNLSINCARVFHVEFCACFFPVCFLRVYSKCD